MMYRLIAGISMEIIAFLLLFVFLIICIRRYKNSKVSKKKTKILCHVVWISCWIFSLFGFWILAPALTSTKSDPKKESQYLFLCMFAVIPCPVSILVFLDKIDEIEKLKERKS